MAPTVERGFLFVVFCSMDITGLKPVISSTSGRSRLPRKFLEWVKTDYLPQALAPGIVARPQLMRIMAHGDGGTSYALHLEVETMGELQRWYRLIGKELQTRLTARFGGRAVGFSTMMEKVEL